MRPFILDIETGGRPDTELFLPEINAPANYKDEAKRAAYIKERREQLITEAPLDAALGRVLCVGLLRPGSEPHFIHHENESQLLRETWLAMETRESGECFVTFNGHKFDFPFLLRRSLVLDVPIPTWFPLGGRFPRYAFRDIAEVWACGDRSEMISLGRLARLCGLPGKNGSGAEFARLWTEDRKTALAYLENDLRLTLSIWQRLARSMPLPTNEVPQFAEP